MCVYVHQFHFIYIYIYKRLVTWKNPCIYILCTSSFGFHICQTHQKIDICFQRFFLPNFFSPFRKKQQQKIHGCTCTYCHNVTTNNHQQQSKQSKQYKHTKLRQINFNHYTIRELSNLTPNNCSTNDSLCVLVCLFLPLFNFLPFSLFSHTHVFPLVGGVCVCVNEII